MDHPSDVASFFACICNATISWVQVLVQRMEATFSAEPFYHSKPAVSAVSLTPLSAEIFVNVNRFVIMGNILGKYV